MKPQACMISSGSPSYNPRQYEAHRNHHAMAADDWHSIPSEGYR